MYVTVVLSGVPYHVSLDELGYNFNIMFDSDEVGTFRLREIDYSQKRLVALDFDNGFDAMAVQDILDDFKYTLHNGDVTKLKARVSTDPKHLPKTPIEDAQMVIPRTDDIGIIFSSASSNRKFVESNSMQTSKFDELLKQQKIAKEKRHLLKVKRKSEREYQKLGDNYENEIPKHSKRYTSESSLYEPRRPRSKSNDWPNDTIRSQCSYKRSPSKDLSTSRRIMSSNREYEARQLSSKVERPRNYRNSWGCDVLYSPISSSPSQYEDEDTIKNYENSNILKQKREEAVQDVLFEINCAVENDRKLLQKSDLKIVTQVFEMYVRSGFKKLNLHKEMLVNEMVICYRRQRSKTEDTAFYQKLIDELNLMDYCDGKLEKGGITNKESRRNKKSKKKKKSQDIWDTVNEVLEEFPMDLLQDYENDEIPNRVADDVNNKEGSCTKPQKRDYNEDANPETLKTCKATAQENIKENAKDRSILDVIEISDDEKVATPSMNIVHSNKSLEQGKYYKKSNSVIHKITTGIKQSSSNISKRLVNTEKIYKTIVVKKKYQRKRKEKIKEGTRYQILLKTLFLMIPKTLIYTIII